MTQVIGFVGVIGSGKDYQADLLVHQKGFVRVDFKDALLEMASDLVGYDVRQDYEWFKRWPVGIRRHPNKFMAEFSKMDAMDLIERHPHLLTGRMLLQRLGTEVMRKRDPDYWVRAWRHQVVELIRTGRSVATADCRFPNEAEAILDVGPTAKLVLCDFHSDRYDGNSPHESERLAQGLLRLGLRDRYEITAADIHREREV